MKVAIASPPFPKSINDGVFWIEKLVKEASEQQAEIVCFPESYIPGYRLEVGEHSPEKLKAALHEVCAIAKEHGIAIILPMDWDHPEGILNVAYVISDKGEITGHQTKNQLDPSEDTMFTPGNKRNLFEVNGVKFGIVICHEGFRYPEATRWAARRGAKIVFHPHCTGSDSNGTIPAEWGHKDNPYYEKAMIMRAMENTIYFASSNYTMRYPESGSAIIAPNGECVVNQAYGKVGIIVADIDPDKATGLLAKRFKPELYS